MVKIENIKITEKKFAKESPDYVFFPQSIEFIITDCSTAIMNALRRTALDETRSIRLSMERKHIETDDPFIINDFIIERFTSIPISQNTPKSARFKLYKHNNSIKPIYVYSKDIIGKDQLDIKLCNRSFPLFLLNPGKSVTITDISVVENYGYIDGKFNFAYSVIPFPLNCDMTQQSASMKVREYKMLVEINGEMDVKKFMQKCCDELIERLRAIDLGKLDSTKDKFVLYVPNETYSMGNLIMEYIDEKYKEIEFATFTVPINSHDLKITISHTSEEDVKKIIREAQEFFCKEFKEIKNSFA